MSTDREYMQRVGAGDPDAFDALFDRYAQHIYRRLLSVVRDETATEDLLQEVFLRLWTRAHQWEGTGTVRGWLTRVATNIALNYLRSVRRRRSQPLKLEMESDEDWETRLPAWMIDEATPSPEEVLEQEEKYREMWSLVDALPDHQREVIRLVHEMEMDIEEAADQLGVPPGTVKSRLHYARKTLAKEWRDIKWRYE